MGNSLHDDGRIPGSFRDPSGYVFFRQGRLFRAIDARCHEVVEKLSVEGVLSQLIKESMIVRSELVADSELLGSLAAEQHSFTHFLEHEVLWPITFLFMNGRSRCWVRRVRAGTIDLQLRLLAAGCSLKDASAYNVQFVGGRPRFIDLGSIERPERIDIWFALGQFQRMFLFPLLLTRYRGWDLRSYFRANLDGRDLEQIARALGWPKLLQPGLLLDVTLPLWLGRWAESSQRRMDFQVRPPSADGLGSPSYGALSRIPVGESGGATSQL